MMLGKQVVHFSFTSFTGLRQCCKRVGEKWMTVGATCNDADAGDDRMLAAFPDSSADAAPQAALLDWRS
jgi:hypothetical protein